jgi:hypothetical protein
MPAPDYTVPGVPCWFDVMTSDADRTRTFYTELFGWTVDDPDPSYGGYFTFRHDGAWVAGGMPKPDPAMPDGWTIYLQTADAKQTADAVAAAGGQVVSPPMDVGPLGTMAILSDPTGAVLGMWQPGEHPGFAAIGEPGAPGWFELHTSDYERALDFYRTAFGWTTQTVGDSDEFRYTVLANGDQQYAGVMDASGWQPAGAAHWEVYIAVDSADETAAKAVKLGGTITEEPVDTPYGRLAKITDPNGASIKLVENNQG